MTFVGPSSGQPRLRIAEVVAFTIAGPGGHDATGYRLEHNLAWASGGAPVWERYCPGDRLAYPLVRRIARTGSPFDPSTSVIPFACSEYDRTGTKPLARPALTGNGVVAKAMSWGFLPGASGVRWGGGAVGGAALHRGAVAAGRADYCADGATHTLDATSILIFDRVDGNQAQNAPALEPSPTTDTLDPTQYSLESIWHEVPGDKVPRWAPLCLSRLRWQALPVGPHCVAGIELPDPRIDPDGRYCDDLDGAALRAGAAAIDVYSQWNDLGLWRWRNAATGDQTTTAYGHYTGDPATSTPPLPGYAAAAPVLEGVSLTVVGKQVFEASYGSGVTADGGVLVQVLACRKPTSGDWLTATADLLTPLGFTEACHGEGFVWSTPPTATVTGALGWRLGTLAIWRNGSGSDYTAATANPGGYAYVAPVGGVILPSL